MFESTLKNKKEHYEWSVNTQVYHTFKQSLEVTGCGGRGRQTSGSLERANNNYYYKNQQQQYLF